MQRVKVAEQGQGDLNSLKKKLRLNRELQLYMVSMMIIKSRHGRKCHTNHKGTTKERWGSFQTGHRGSGLGRLGLRGQSLS